MQLIQDLFNSLIGFVQNLTGDQIVALLLGLAVLYGAGKVVQKGLSIILTVVGIMLALYFVAPELYNQVVLMAQQLWSQVSGAVASVGG